MIGEVDNDRRLARPAELPPSTPSPVIQQQLNALLKSPFAEPAQDRSPALFEIVAGLESAAASRVDPAPALSHPRTSVHVFEPVRDALDQVVDFRLNFGGQSTPHPYRDFAGVKLVEVGPSVAPGETFHALRRVLESGEPVRSTTRYVCGTQVHLFQQTAERVGDAVITTTTIVLQPSDRGQG